MGTGSEEREAFPLGSSFQTSFWGVNSSAGGEQGTPGPETLLEHSRVDHAVASEDFGVGGAGARPLGVRTQQMLTDLATPCPATDKSFPFSCHLP